MEFLIHNKLYTVIKLLGHGKGGYSYLAMGPDGKVVVKKIHHEPCDYYAFGNKIEAEKNDYQRLLNAGISIPKMIDIDEEQEIIVKEYIDGKTISELIENKEDISIYIPQVQLMADLAKKAGLNIDYYPTNFVPYKEKLYYIDYECNEYSEKWNLENWGMQYWKNN